MRPAFLKYIAVMVFISGCVSNSRQFIPFPDQSKEVEGSGKGRIYVMRPPKFWSDATPVKIFDGDTLMGVNEVGGFLSWEREPGNTRIRSLGRKVSSLDLQVQEGGRQYVRQRVSLSGKSSFDLIGPDEGQNLLRRQRPPKVHLNRTPADLAGRTRWYLLRNDWRSSSFLSVVFSFQGAILAEFQREIVVRHSEPSSIALQFGVGVFDTMDSKVRVKYADNSKRNGSLALTAFPLSLGVFRYGRQTPFFGKWGIEANVYPYDGHIDMKDGAGLYKAKGYGANLVIPFQGVASFSGNRTTVRLDWSWQIPLVKSDFDSPYAHITGIRPFSGFFIGFSAGRVF